MMTISMDFAGYCASQGLKQKDLNYQFTIGNETFNLSDLTAVQLEPINATTYTYEFEHSLGVIYSGTLVIKNGKTKIQCFKTELNGDKDGALAALWSLLDFSIQKMVHQNNKVLYMAMIDMDENGIPYLSFDSSPMYYDEAQKCAFIASNQGFVMAIPNVTKSHIHPELFKASDFGSVFTSNKSLDNKHIVECMAELKIEMMKNKIKKMNKDILLLSDSLRTEEWYSTLDLIANIQHSKI